MPILKKGEHAPIDHTITLEDLKRESYDPGPTKEQNEKMQKEIKNMGE